MYQRIIDLLMENTSDRVFLLDENQRVLNASTTVLNQTGLDKIKLSNISFESLCQKIGVTLPEEFNLSLIKDKHYFHCKNKTEMSDNVLIVAPILYQTQMCYLVLAKNPDFNELLNKYYQLITMIQHMPYNVYWMNADLVHMGCNKNVLNMLGLDYDKYIGSTYEELSEWANWPEGLAESFKSADIQVLQTGQPIHNIEEMPFSDIHGEHRYLLTSRVPLKDCSSNLTGVAGISVDITELKTTQKELAMAMEQTQTLKIKQALIDSAAQVSHDIRSPLAALNTILKDLSMFPEDKRILIRNAVRQIDNIANNLLSRYRDNKNSEKEQANKKTVELLSSLLDALVSEKNVQTGGHSIELCLEISQLAYGAFVLIDVINIRRTLSNLLNNAIEAIAEKGLIRVKLDQVDDHMVIQIIDNGKGISPALLKKIKTYGGSYGKKEGTGIGIAKAVDCVNAHDGVFDIVSKEGQGTVVSIQLPQVKTPLWFQHTLTLTKGMILVIVDDDASIHSVWNSRCQSYLSDIEIVHLYNGDEVKEFYSMPKNAPTLYLMDYELLSSKESGLDLIDSLAIQDKAILVTSRYEEPSIRSRTAELSLRILPKNYAPFIPIELVDDKEQPDMVLIDDDAGIRDLWKMAAKDQDMILHSFSSTIEFKQVINQLDKMVPIYIDSNLAEPIKGEDYAKELHQQGFSSLYLASGYPAEYFGELPWIKGFVSKAPPF